MQLQMKRLLILMTLLGCSYNANAQLLSWASQSDVICTAKVLSVKPIENGTFPEPYGMPVKFYLANVRVESFYKGSAEDPTLDLELYQLDIDALRKQNSGGFGFSGWAPFHQLKTGSKYLFFAKKLLNQDRYYLTGISEGNSSVIEYTGIASQTQEDKSVLYNVLLQLSTMIQEKELATAIQPNTTNALQLVGEYGKFLKVPDNQFHTYLYNNRDLLKEDDTKTIADYLQTSVIPQIKKLTQSQQQSVRKWAVFAAASLQVVDALPQVITQTINESAEQGFYTNMLSLYGTPEATPLLIPLLKNSNPKIQSKAINALRNSMDRRSLPFLIDVLKSPDFNVRKSAIIALLVITKESLGASSPRVVSQETEDIYLSFWKNWVREHKEELDKLRGEI